jgi:hypothetical protein
MDPYNKNTRINGSPVFRVRLAAIAAGQSLGVDFESDTFTGYPAGSAAKYTPFNHIRIQNNSAQSLDVFINSQPGNVRTVASLQDVVIEGNDISVWGLLVKNLGAVDTVANDITVEAKVNAIESGDVVKGVAKKFAGWL